MSNISRADIFNALRHDPKRLAMVKAQLKVAPGTVGDVGCDKVMVSHAMELKTGPNTRLQRMERARLVKQERQVAASLLKSKREIPRLPVVVTLTRVGRKRMDDDNLRGAFKAVRDGIADVYGIGDDDERIKFVYAQNVADFEPAIWIDVEASK